MGEYFKIVNPATQQFLDPGHMFWADKLHGRVDGYPALATALLVCKSDRLHVPLAGSWYADPVNVAGDYEPANCVVCLVVGALVVATAVFQPQQFIYDPQHNILVATRCMLNRLRGDTEMSVIGSRRLPRDGIGGFIRLLNEDSKLGFDKDFAVRRRVKHPGIDKGIDAWGRKLVMEVRGATVYIRSTGANGKDERGSR